MQLYREYCKELYDREVLQNECGFLTYKKYDDGSLYVHSVFVTKKHRRKGFALSLEKQLIEKENPVCIYCYVDLTTQNHNDSLKGLLNEGYIVDQSTPETIVLKKVTRSL